MRAVLDSGGLSALASDRFVLAEFSARLTAPPFVPSAVLCEALTGDHRRDHGVNRLLAQCEVVVIGERLSRVAAGLRTRTGRAGSISAVDALVAAVGVGMPGSTVVTSDPDDLSALLSCSNVAVGIARV